MATIRKGEGNQRGNQRNGLTTVKKEDRHKGATSWVMPSSINLQLIDFIGGAEGDRTPDLMTASHALSHLSYSPIFIVYSYNNRQ